MCAPPVIARHEGVSSRGIIDGRGLAAAVLRCDSARMIGSSHHAHGCCCVQHSFIHIRTARHVFHKRCTASCLLCWGSWATLFGKVFLHKSTSKSRANRPSYCQRWVPHLASVCQCFDFSFIFLGVKRLLPLLYWFRATNTKVLSTHTRYTA